FLQWIADASFAAAQARARTGGMRTGLIADLAIGMDRGGSDAWAPETALLLGLSLGAPRDLPGRREDDLSVTRIAHSAIITKRADIDTREALGLVPDAAGERTQRESERSVLWRSFKRAGVATGNPPAPDEPDAAVDAAVCFVAKSASRLAMIPIEDALGLAEQ